MADWNMDWGRQAIPLNGTAVQSPDVLQSMQTMPQFNMLAADHLPTGDLMAAGSGTGGWGAGLSGVGDFFKNSGFLGSTAADGTKTQGWGGMAFGGLQALGNTFMGMKQYGLAKDQLAQSKKQFDLNYGAQQKTTNAALSDRQNARVASNPGAYQSVADYMKKNGI